MLLEILRPLEGLSTKVALVWLEGHMDADVRGNVVALDGRGATCSPLTGQVEVVGAFATDMAFADVVLRYCQHCDPLHVSAHRDLHRVLRGSRIAHRSLAIDRSSCRWSKSRWSEEPEPAAKRRPGLLVASRPARPVRRFAHRPSEVRGCRRVLGVFALGEVAVDVWR